MYNKVIMMGRIVNDLEVKTENPISSMLSHGVTRQNSFQDILQKDA